MSARADGHVPLPNLLERLGATHEIEPTRSRTAEILIARPRPGVDARTLLIKHCEPRYVPSPEAAYLALVRCDAAGRRASTPFVPSPECWGADPPYVCTEFVESRRLSEIYAELLARGTDDDARDMLALAMRAGMTLARFHRALPLTESSERERANSPRLHWIARRLVRSPRGAAAPLVRLHTDFGPQNLIITATDEMLVVDLPGSDRVGALGEDLGRFIDAATRRIRANPALRAAIVDAVLTGYESESETRVRTGDRRALVESFAARHALLMVIDGVRNGSPRRIRSGIRSITAARHRVRANR